MKIMIRSLCVAAVSFASLGSYAKNSLSIMGESVLLFKKSGRSIQFSLGMLRALFFIPVLIALGACSHTTLEDQFRGIEACRIGDVFLDPLTNKPSGQYFIQRKLEPCLLDEAAVYCVNDTFYGMAVNEVVIPYRGPFSVHAIYLKEKPTTVEATLRAHFKDIRLNQNDGVSPILIANPKQQGGSVFYCDKYSE